MYYDYEFYDEPNEFEIMINDFKQSIAKSVKKEIVDEMESLKKENEKLQNIKKNYNNILNEYRKKEKELEHKKEQLENKIRKERISELMKNFEVVLYQPDTDYKILPKCNKCDDNRRIYYTTPLGQKTYEICDCDNRELYYVPRKSMCKQFNIEDGKFQAWYTLRTFEGGEYYEYTTSTHISKLYDGETDYEKFRNNKTSVLFRDEEECQKYCDWLNKNKI